jgi:WD40 repeat protein
MVLPAASPSASFVREDGAQESGFGVASEFSPDGRLVATEKSGSTHIWDASSGALLASTRTTNSTPIMRLAFSSDGRRLISGGIEWQVWIGEVPTGRTIRYVDTTTYEPFAYHAESELLVTADSDGAQFNDAATGRQIAMLGRHADKLALSADGTRLFVGSDDSGEIRIWPLPRPGAERVRLARQLVPRCLTPLQLEEAGLDPTPPRWCITGPDMVAEKDPAKWVGKWPYRTAEWRNWLLARDRGESPRLPNYTQGGPPPPKPEESDGSRAQVAPISASQSGPR